MGQRLATASLLLMLAFMAGHAHALTDPDQLQLIIAFRDAMLARGGNWTTALSTWTCPTPPDNSDESCDPCGDKVWGNWDHMACRGPPVDYTEDRVPGEGLVTNIHITDNSIEGSVPIEELCPLKGLREFDVDGGKLTGPIPVEFAQCFPRLREIDLSYNQLSGPVPKEIADNGNLEQFKAEKNFITGSFPAEFGNMPRINWLRFHKNQMSGPIPESLSNTVKTLYQLTLDNNDFEGNLEMLANHKMLSFTAQNNPKLCGMVPVGVRFAHGFNYHNTGLGMPCPDQ